MLHADAAMAHIARVFGKEVALISVVQKHTEFVVKTKHDAPQRVPYPARLNDQVVFAHEHTGCYPVEWHFSSCRTLSYKEIARLKIFSISCLWQN